MTKMSSSWPICRWRRSYRNTHEYPHTLYIFRN